MFNVRFFSVWIICSLAFWANPFDAVCPFNHFSRKILDKIWKIKTIQTVWQNTIYKLPKTRIEKATYSSFLLTFNEHFHLGPNYPFRDLLNVWRDCPAFRVLRKWFRMWKHIILILHVYLQILNNKMLKPNNEHV